MKKATVCGPHGIRATVLAYSIAEGTGQTFITFEIEYPRIILAELNTHRADSKNSASSRAIPFKKMLEQLYARPVRFGQANPGMQDKGEDFAATVNIGWDATAEEAWEVAKREAVDSARAFYEAGYHKQVYNRLVEPFQMMKTVFSGTEMANFYWLRDHGAADPTIAALAKAMFDAQEQSTPDVLAPGEWHLPYVDSFRDREGVLHYGDADDDGCGWTEYELEGAIKVSCARCAAVSFRNVDYDLDKSKGVYDRLVGDERKHASAFEHCATPMRNKSYDQHRNIPCWPSSWEPGISHMDRDSNLWSGNLKGFIQYRKLIPGENYTGA